MAKKGVFAISSVSIASLTQINNVCEPSHLHRDDLRGKSWLLYWLKSDFFIFVKQCVFCVLSVCVWQACFSRTQQGLYLTVHSSLKSGFNPNMAYFCFGNAHWYPDLKKIQICQSYPVQKGFIPWYKSPFAQWQNEWALT